MSSVYKLASQFPGRRQFGQRPSSQLPNTSDSEYVRKDLVFPPTSRVSAFTITERARTKPIQLSRKINQAQSKKRMVGKLALV